MALFQVRNPTRFLMPGAVLSALVLSSCSQNLTQSSMIGEGSAPTPNRPMKIIASPVPGAPVEDEETETEERPTSNPGPWGPTLPKPTLPTTPAWDPWNPFGFPKPTAPKTEPKDETKTETPKPKWDPLNPFNLKPKEVDPPAIGPVVVPKMPPKAEPTKAEPSTPTSTWPKTPAKPNPPIAPVTPTRPEVIKDETNAYDLLKIMTRSFGQSIGVYDRGSLTRPDQLANLGEGFFKIFQDRNRGYGSLDMISLLAEASREIHRDFPAAERVQIGDISDKNGGRLGGHGSHQNGLDADLAYFRKDRVEMPTTGSRPGSTGFGAGFVSKGQILPTFDTETNWRFIQMLDATGRLDRIFVDQRIKKEFCKFSVAKGMRPEWKNTLRKLRHWPNHADHMHVRISCPVNSKACKPIPAIPTGDGCDVLLDRGGVVRTSGAFYLNAEEQRRHDAMGKDEIIPEPAIEEHGC